MALRIAMQVGCLPGICTTDLELFFGLLQELLSETKEALHVFCFCNEHLMLSDMKLLIRSS